MSWSKKQKGKTYHQTPLPYLKDNYKAERVTWAIETKKMLGEEKLLVCFIEKKWFYTTGRQRRLKHLPRGTHEPKGVDRVKRPRSLSRRFPVKVMFMGVVSKHLLELGFDGRIFLKRISERKVWKKTNYNQRFPDNAIINS